MNDARAYRYTPEPGPGPCPEHPHCLIRRCERFLCDATFHLPI